MKTESTPCDPGDVLCLDQFVDAAWVDSSGDLYGQGNFSQTFFTFNGSLHEGSDEAYLYTWTDYQKELQWTLQLHIYGFSCLFFMLSFYTFFSILNLRSQLSIRPFMSTINVFVCALAVSRAASFLIDPYYSQKLVPRFLAWVLWDVGFPCILSAFGLIQLAFSQLTQMTFPPALLRKRSFLSIVIVCHFVCVFISDVVATFEPQLQLVRLIVQTVFISWGILLCFTFLYSGGRILRVLKTLPNSAFQNSEPVTRHKGILQLALLAQCNDIASSVITAAAAPSTILTPKIKITDENELSYSIGSEASKFSISVSANDASEAGQLNSVPEFDVTEAERPTEMNNPLVKIELCEEEPTKKSESATEGENLSPKGESQEPPKRKKSLTWEDETNPEETRPSTSKGCSGATLGCEMAGNSRRKRRSSKESSSRKNSATSGTSSRKNSATSGTSSRKNSSTCESGSRRGSNTSVSSKRGSCSSDRSRRKSSLSDSTSRRGSHVGEALVQSRRGSKTSERRDSSLTVQEGSSRRGSRRSMKDEAEFETLLERPSTPVGDVTLSSILNHIAYVNQANVSSKLGTKVKESRKDQVRQVLVVTYVSAVLGMALSLLLIGGLHVSPPPKTLIKPWVWFSYETACRLLEFLIGCAMANITRQPVNRYSQYGHTLRMKARNSLYI